MSTAKICAETLLNLIGNVLDVSKIQANKLELSASCVDLRETLQKLIQMFQTIAKNKGIYVKLIEHSLIPKYLQADNGRIMQVLMNLLGNAIKFTEKGGVLVVVDWIPAQEEVNFAEVKKILSVSKLTKYIDSIKEMNTEEEKEFSPKAFQKYTQSPHQSMLI
jgi:signal transduction histidine kinase